MFDLAMDLAGQAGDMLDQLEKAQNTLAKLVALDPNRMADGDENKSRARQHGDDDINIRYHGSMNSKQRRTHAALFETPVRKDITWHDVTSLFEALGATVTQGEGSRVRVALHDMKAVFHQPHPRPELPTYAVKDTRDFLEQAGELP